MVETRVIRALLEAAGEIAMDHYLHVSSSLKEDSTIVTEADLAVQEFLIEALERHFPRDGLIAEEYNLRKDPRSGDRYWTLDPIDGTVPFAAGLTSWSIALGLLDAGQPVRGFIYTPTSRDFFHAAPGVGACRNGRAMAMKTPGALSQDAILLTHTRPHQRYRLAASYPGRVFSLGSASVHLSLVATGAADAVLIGHDRVWDLVPGTALLSANGGILRYLGGEEVNLSALLSGSPAPRPMLGGHEEVIDQIEAHLDYYFIDSPRP